MKIMIIGADGQLGCDLCKVIPKEDQIPLTIKEIDITDPQMTTAVLKQHSPEVVINTAAYHRVDDCEDNILLALKVNAYGVRNLALAAKEVGAALVSISTDYVFSGDRKKPYSEKDVPEPKSAYGISKLAGEFFARYILQKYFIVRTCGLYGVAGCMGKGGTNFVEGMIKKAKQGGVIRVVDDEFVSPTYTYDLAQALYKLIQTNRYGIHHIANSGSCSWYQFAAKIFELTGIKADLQKATGADYPTKAYRPKYSVLASRFGLRIWKDALKAYIDEKKYISKLI
ncbi:dTDP-4-dehydrorhamnose reductase [candidate division WOR-1 bacterium RIFOXYA12_FULL_43_27]|uniref:dTDP-4-dehydrorhamnose reductase n=1 Tax=candidate division WOR-1 bacterium RIFOXYC2_FULL_46_14 TaxID=1802587 RepID=A0A1F4U3J4_UNCSA|nr:MAG: dTDP-4-dehydrorhamnose reductase [candidate division WOR-1 bacterium RIFOXYA12_FULL_43_27]OGC20115.1 MAG: dTDP-4-dehydrorhamnose reductase [candidate division WOR-1 bacterium RIFOXYB2_FULL_46_45]OGC32148.1 MAG: dTDP-4-dehydrorhamnose reductase [candidate division WOR-1 bacterium RIFOXYA2_FULL_46_56]OGC39548.1 MAG: dTDP-4-dehydrorhamnose reductase [candidate division WOR-1 bacterium RIFOXYC2_FULL_46_14]